MNRKRKDSGQVAVLLIMAGVFFALLAGLVFNSGRDAHQKIRAQAGADATTISAATAAARTLNLISANNVQMAKLLGAALALQGLSQNILLGSKIIPGVLAFDQAMCSATGWTGAGLFFCTHYWVVYALQNTVYQNGFKEALDKISKYDTGILWRLARALDTMNQGLVATSGVTPLTTAYEIAEANKADIGFVYPAIAPLPLERGDFSLLCHATKYGSPTQSESKNSGRRGWESLINVNDPDRRWDYGPFLEYVDTIQRFMRWPNAVITYFVGWSLYERMADAVYSKDCDGEPKSVAVDVKVDCATAIKDPSIKSIPWMRTEITSKPLPERELSKDLWACSNDSTSARDAFDDRMGDGDASGSIDLDGILSDAAGRATSDCAPDPRVKSASPREESYPNPSGTPDNQPYRGEIVQTDVGDYPKEVYKTCDQTKQPTADNLRCDLDPDEGKWFLYEVAGCQVDEATGVESCARKEKVFLGYEHQTVRWVCLGVTKTQNQPVQGMFDDSTASGGPPLPTVFEGLTSASNDTLAGDDLVPLMKKLRWVGVTVYPNRQGVFPGAYERVFDQNITYAQSRVYNPSSWDLFTQDWQAKLTPVDMLDDLVGGLNDGDYNAGSLGETGSSISSYNVGGQGLSALLGNFANLGDRAMRRVNVH